jgi:hypothetical protein
MLMTCQHGRQSIMGVMTHPLSVPSFKHLADMWHGRGAMRLRMLINGFNVSRILRLISIIYANKMPAWQAVHLGSKGSHMLLLPLRTALGYLTPSWRYVHLKSVGSVPAKASTWNFLIWELDRK